METTANLENRLDVHVHELKRYRMLFPAATTPRNKDYCSDEGIYQYDDSTHAVSSQLVEVGRQTGKRLVVDCEHFAFIVMINVGILNVLRCEQRVRLIDAFYTVLQLSNHFRLQPRCQISLPCLSLPWRRAPFENRPRTHTVIYVTNPRNYCKNRLLCIVSHKNTFGGKYYCNVNV